LPRSPRPELPQGPYLIVGLRRAGLAAARALAGRGSLHAWDRDHRPDTERARAELAVAGVAVTLGGDGIALLDGIRTVVKSPGVRPDTPVIKVARRRGIETIDELELGWRLDPSPILAVTGTNGKSTAAALLVAVLAAAGRRPALAGNTFDGPPLSAVPRDGHDCVVAEVSSYQAEAVARFLPDAALFTNLTRDHIHRHGSMAAYGTAKRRVFVDRKRAVPLASINGDDRFGRRLAEDVRARGGTALTYGTCASNDYRIGAVASTLTGATFHIETPAGRADLQTRLPGVHNALNVAAVLALADGLDVDRAASLAALAAADPPPGRFEPVPTEHRFDIVVDFAYSPDSVANVLDTARAIAAGRDGRAIAVLGVAAGGDRRTRELVGRAARERADVLVLSAWSLRGEPPVVSLQGVLAGARAASGGRLECVLDRRAAIARGLAHARPGDVVAVLGRGDMPSIAHDRHGGRTRFDDREVVRELLGHPIRTDSSKSPASRVDA